MTEPTLREQNLQISLLKVLADAIAEQFNGKRKDHLKVLLADHENTGSRTFEVRLPDGEETLGRLSLTGPKDDYDVDEAALIDWAKVNAPEMVEEVVVPPQPEQRFSRLWPASLAALLKRVEVDKDTGKVMDGPREIPGLTFKPGGKPTNFSVSLTADGKRALLDAYTSGRLRHLEGAPEVAQIEEERPPWE